MPAIKGKAVLIRRNRVTLNCVICNSEYEQHAYRSQTSKYCSKDCWSKRAHKKCLVCKKDFGTVGHWGLFFCSKACSGLAISKSNHPGWKDGLSLTRERSRNSGKLSAWKKAVKKRDNHCCVKCGAQDNLHVHHVLGLSEHPDLAAVVSNGMTLCDVCHSITHGRWVGSSERKKIANFTSLISKTEKAKPAKSAD